jgi:cytochrome P450
MSIAAMGGRTTAPGLRQLIPLPWPGSPLARSRRDPLGFLLEAFHRYGDLFRYQLGPLVFHQVAHPEHVKHVLVDHARNYPRSWYYDRTKVVVGEGLVTTEGAAWRRLRRMAQPAFHPHRVAALAGAMADAIGAMLGRWQEHARTGAPLDIAAEFARLTLRIAGHALLGLDLAGEAERIGAAVTTALEYLERRINHLVALPPGVPTPGNIRARRALQTFATVIEEILAGRRRESWRDTGDLLAMLLAVRDEETGAGLTDRDLRDQVITFIGAGHETTAVALAWTIYLLSRHPEVETRLRSEVGEVLDGRRPSADDLPRLLYTRRVIEEALRLYPPVYAVIRDAVADDAIGGFPIPARSMIILSPYVTHRHPEFWPEPETFDPDRFRPERAVGRPRFAWYPFLAGPHQCIGQEFALMEMTLTVAMLAQAFRFQLAPGARVEPKPMLSLRPRHGMPMILQTVP